MVDALGAVLVEEPLEFEFRNGMFYVSGAEGPQRVMRPNTFFATVAAAASAGREFRFGGAEIIPFPKASPGGH